ncbi:hypothetical protein PSEUDO8O_30367 [Pseudomonas sp. 8O]|nr:hypothetical protein PSEUDO8O_30367 [Pseudomonas sp. 8O]
MADMRDTLILAIGIRDQSMSGRQTPPNLG